MTTTEPTAETAAEVPTASRSTDAAPRRRGYGARWAALPRELGYLLLGFPIAIVAFTVLVTLFSTGVSLIVIAVGVVVVLAALYTARGLGAFELMRLRWAGRPPVREPRWQRGPEGEGAWASFLRPLIDGHYWLYLLHGMVVFPIVSLFSWIVTVVWVSVALGGLTAWIWDRLLVQTTSGSVLQDSLLFRAFARLAEALGVEPIVLAGVGQFVLGAVLLLTLPFITGGLTRLHEAVDRGMLGGWRSEALERQVAQLSASRGAAVQAEDAALRRLERDIHDGPQQRLVRLQMDLAAIERKLDVDPEAARALLGEAREQARDTLDELRALSRGFAPPLLQDRGLASALESLAARSPVPVTLEVQATDAALPAAIERNAYFIAAELLTNAVKHASASAVRLRLSTRDTGPSGLWLDLWVTDNGHGGAATVPGHGLAGLDERVRGLGGLLVIDSPAGGPTVIGAHFPYVPEPAATEPVPPTAR